jgi:hypothetical protein
MQHALLVQTSVSFRQALISSASIIGSLWAHGDDWSREDNKRLIKLWSRKRSVADIAVELGRTSGAVYEHAKKIGLEPRRGARFDAAVVLVQIKGYGFFPRVILRRGNKAKRARAVASKAKFNEAYRGCLSCGKSFQSTWIGNRMCDECKEIARTML